jgi:Flp pilus assembly protein TadG
MRRLRTSTSKTSPRAGATVVECAIVAPVTFLMVLGIVICGLGIFRMHQIEHLSEAAARWAALHGPRYQKRTGTAAPTSQDVLNNFILPRAVSLRKSAVTCDLQWSADKSTVTVDLRYQWTPETFWSPITFRSATTVASIQ